MSTSRFSGTFLCRWRRKLAQMVHPQFPSQTYERRRFAEAGETHSTSARRKSLREHSKHNSIAVCSALVGRAVEPVSIRHQVAEGVQTISSTGECVKQRIGPSSPCSWYKLIDRAGVVLAVAVRRSV